MFVRFFRILAGVTEIRRNKFPLSIFRESNQEAIDSWKKYVWPRLKKQKIEDAVLILWDESVFSLHSNRRLAWSDIGVTPIRFAVCPKHRPGHHNHTGIGFITRTPVRHLLDFRFTIFNGSSCFESLCDKYGVFMLTDLHRYDGRKVIISIVPSRCNLAMASRRVKVVQHAPYERNNFFYIRAAHSCRRSHPAWCLSTKCRRRLWH